MDVAVAYRLYRETGKMINLGDWWIAFEGAAWDEEEGKGSKGKRRREASGEEDEGEEEDEEDEEGAEDAQRRKQARFLRAVGDLAYVGFLQPTSRKPEHVLKSVF